MAPKESLPRYLQHWQFSNFSQGKSKGNQNHSLVLMNWVQKTTESKVLNFRVMVVMFYECFSIFLHLRQEACPLWVLSPGVAMKYCLICLSLQSRCNFMERVLSIFMVKIIAAITGIFDFYRRGRLRWEINLYQGGEWGSKGRQEEGVGSRLSTTTLNWNWGVK